MPLPFTLQSGDCREVLRILEESSMDVCVTDPPYELGFMGKDWDSRGVSFQRETWAEVLRVLKPGAHLLAFGGTRTYHRIACAIEDAGFEIRDCIVWLYGSGFPKSLNVGKAIDQAGGDAPKQQAEALRAAREAQGLSRAELAAKVGCTEASVRDWEEGRARAKGRPTEWIIPSAAYRKRLREILPYSEDFRVCTPGGVDRQGDGTVYGLGHTGAQIIGGLSARAQAWKGFGTALKPAYEPIIVARKPLAGTVAQNVLEYSTGGLNIDGCRIQVNKDDAEAMKRCNTPGSGRMKKGGSPIGTFARSSPTGELDTMQGRWPANVVLDEEAAQALDEQSGITKSGAMKREVGAYDGTSHTKMLRGKSGPSNQHGDSGGASRFFYTAKVSPAERNAAGENRHPTVKPLALMRYLVKLVTPPGGLVLDPFMGSGSTGVAAILEGDRFVGIDLLPDHVSLAQQRILHYFRRPVSAAAVQEIEVARCY